MHEYRTASESELLEEIRLLRSRIERLEGVDRSSSGRRAPSQAPTVVERRPDNPPTGTTTAAPPTDRRHLFKRVGIAAGAAAVGVAATTLDAAPAAAWNGDPLLVGIDYNEATAPTRALNRTTTNANLFEFSDQSIGAPAEAWATLSSYAEEAPFAIQGYSTLDGGAGVRARSTGDGSSGLTAWASGMGSIGIGATGSTAAIQTLMSTSTENVGVSVIGGYRGVEIASYHQLSFVAGITPGPPTIGTARIGDFHADSSGVVWYCTSAGTPGSWQRVCGPGTAGAFIPVDPTRVYDSRLGSGAGTGILGTGASRVVSIADGIDLTTGAVTVPDIVPTGSTAIQYNLTVTDTVGSGYLQVAPGYATGITSSSINWSGSGQTIANGLTVKVSSNRQVKATVGPGATQFIIDVLGYYR